MASIDGRGGASDYETAYVHVVANCRNLFFLDGAFTPPELKEGIDSHEKSELIQEAMELGDRCVCLCWNCGCELHDVIGNSHVIYEKDGDVTIEPMSYHIRFCPYCGDELDYPEDMFRPNTMQNRIVFANGMILGANQVGSFIDIGSVE
ncbi:hypothetical protein [Paratractidigestivibacter sp.]|uniref:hypothetical protein n=1 Tax=Paratractidigestivibacter sp. TaxID=2847316 RepID=UPI002ABD9262|nr:hypothetical protein [Paratractidigestivibacter sp.]